MIEQFHNIKYCSWQLNLTEFKANSKFNDSLRENLDNFDTTKKLPDSANGKAYSVLIHKENKTNPNVSGFNELIDLVMPSLDENLEKICGSKSKRMISCWANRMHVNSYGSIHTHVGVDYVMLLYYNVPENSSDLIFIHPKYGFYDKDVLSIPQTDQLKIKVSEGMCLLHEGKMLHAVSIHNNRIPREVIVLEFKTDKQ